MKGAIWCNKNCDWFHTVSQTPNAPFFVMGCCGSTDALGPEAHKDAPLTKKAVAEAVLHSLQAGASESVLLPKVEDNALNKSPSVGGDFVVVKAPAEKEDFVIITDAEKAEAVASERVADAAKESATQGREALEAEHAEKGAAEAQKQTEKEAEEAQDKAEREAEAAKEKAEQEAQEVNAKAEKEAEEEKAQQESEARQEKKKVADAAAKARALWGASEAKELAAKQDKSAAAYWDGSKEENPEESPNTQNQADVLWSSEAEEKAATAAKLPPQKENATPEKKVENSLEQEKKSPASSKMSSKMAAFQAKFNQPDNTTPEKPILAKSSSHTKIAAFQAKLNSPNTPDNVASNDLAKSPTDKPVSSKIAGLQGMFGAGFPLGGMLGPGGQKLQKTQSAPNFLVGAQDSPAFSGFPENDEPGADDHEGGNDAEHDEAKKEGEPEHDEAKKEGELTHAKRVKVGGGQRRGQTKQKPTFQAPSFPSVPSDKASGVSADSTNEPDEDWSCERCGSVTARGEKVCSICRTPRSDSEPGTFAGTALELSSLVPPVVKEVEKTVSVQAFDGFIRDIEQYPTSIE